MEGSGTYTDHNGSVIPVVDHKLQRIVLRDDVALETSVDRLRDDIVDFLRGHDLADGARAREPRKQHTSRGGGRVERVIQLPQTISYRCIVSELDRGETP